MAGSRKPSVLESVHKQLSVRVAELRTEKGMTQSQLAKTAGLALQYLSKIEQGDRAPSLKTLVALASGLGVPVAELFNFEGREIVSPRTEVQLLQLRSLLGQASEEDIKLLNRLAERLVEGPPSKKRRRS